MTECTNKGGQEFSAGVPLVGTNGQRKPDVVASRTADAAPTPGEIPPVKAPGRLPRRDIPSPATSAPGS